MVIDFIALTLLWILIVYIRNNVKAKLKGKNRRACINRLCIMVPMYGLFAIASILTTFNHIWEIWF